MIPACFDTVVLLQAGGKPDGPAGACLRLVVVDQVELHVSPAQVAELEDVLGRERVRRKFPRLTPEHIAHFLQGLRSKARIVTEIPELFRYPRDPDDEPIVNLALAAGVRFLVTRDLDLLDLMEEDNPEGAAFRRSWPTLLILNPVAFLSVVNPPRGT